MIVKGLRFSKGGVEQVQMRFRVKQRLSKGSGLSRGATEEVQRCSGAMVKLQWCRGAGEVQRHRPGAVAQRCIGAAEVLSLQRWWW